MQFSASHLSLSVLFARGHGMLLNRPVVVNMAARIPIAPVRVDSLPASIRLAVKYAWIGSVSLTLSIVNRP